MRVPLSAIRHVQEFLEHYKKSENIIAYQASGDVSDIMEVDHLSSFIERPVFLNACLLYTSPSPRDA